MENSYSFIAKRFERLDIKMDKFYGEIKNAYFLMKFIQTLLILVVFVIIWKYRK